MFPAHLTDVGVAGADGDAALPRLRAGGLEVGAVLAGGGPAADGDCKCKRTSMSTSVGDLGDRGSSQVQQTPYPDAHEPALPPPL